LSAVRDGLFNICAAFCHTDGRSCISNLNTRRTVMTGTHCSPEIIRMVKSRRIRWTEFIARKGRGEVHTGFWWENLRDGDHLEDTGVDGSIILKWIFEKWDGGHGLVWSVSG